MANVGVMEGVDVSVGSGVLDGGSVGVEAAVGVIGVDDLIIGVAAIGVAGSEG
jgi:hypothetical protein